MTLNYHQLAEKLDQAAMSCKATEQLSISRALNLEEAYAVQGLSLSRRYLRGEQHTGLKLGFTSKAKMEQMGVHDMIWGRLTDKMIIPHEGACQRNHFIHPRAEPEIAFRVSGEITEILDAEDIKSKVDGLATAIEVIDSRYQNFKFSLADVIADNCSSSGYCIGAWQDSSTDISDIKMNISLDGKMIHEGTSSAILGNPWESMAAASRLALEHGIILKEGDIVLAGAATAAVFLEAGQQVSVYAEGLGVAQFTIK